MIKFFNSKTFCILPWVNVSTDTNGDVRLCCVSNRFIEKSHGQRYNLGRDSLKEIINSENLKAVRQDMLLGKQIAGCERCYHDEQFGGKSNRVWHTMHFFSEPKIKNKVIDSISSNEIQTVEYFDIRFGNLCNLACRSCNPGASSQFNREISELEKTTNIKKFHIALQDNNNWNNTETFYQNLSSQFSSIDYYYMNGGEPTIIESNLQLLRQMIDQGVSKKINLSLNSNMTNSRQEFYSLLDKFKTVRFMASIDGIADMQEYLRYPSAWSQIDKNFQKLLATKSPNTKIQVTPVISKINLAYITDLFLYLDQLKDQYQIEFEINPIILHQPSLLDVQFLPLDYKKECWQKISQYIMLPNKKHSRYFHDAMKILEKKTSVETAYLDNLNDFYQYNDILDSHRKQSLKTVNPKLESFRNLL